MCLQTHLYLVPQASPDPHARAKAAVELAIMFAFCAARTSNRQADAAKDLILVGMVRASMGVGNGMGFKPSTSSLHSSSAFGLQSVGNDSWSDSDDDTADSKNEYGLPNKNGLSIQIGIGGRPFMAKGVPIHGGWEKSGNCLSFWRHVRITMFLFRASGRINDVPSRPHRICDRRTICYVVRRWRRGGSR